MRTVKDRVLLLVNSIIGQSEFSELLENEDVCFFNGALLQKDVSRDAIRCMEFSLNDKSVLDPNNHFLTRFDKPFHKIENDENKYLQVYIKSNPSPKDDWVTLHNNLAKENTPLLEKLAQLVGLDDPVLQVRQEFEEFKGQVHHYIKFAVRQRGGNAKCHFMSTSNNLTDNMVFWQSVTWYLAQFYATYVKPEDLKNDFDGIIASLPAMVTDDDFFTRETKRPFEFPFKR
jgi:hypothetical protein